MAEFISTSSGFINLDHVLLIRVGVQKEEGLDLVQMLDGRIIQCEIHDRSFLPGVSPTPRILRPDDPDAAAETDVGFGDPVKPT